MKNDSVQVLGGEAKVEGVVLACHMLSILDSMVQVGVCSYQVRTLREIRDARCLFFFLADLRPCIVLSWVRISHDVCLVVWADLYINGFDILIVEVSRAACGMKVGRFGVSTKATMLFGFRRKNRERRIYIRKKRGACRCCI